MTRPASSSSDAFRTMYRTNLASQCKMDLFSNILSCNKFTCIKQLVFISQVASVAKERFCKRNCTLKMRV